jgi:DNA-binding NarL/FixJ family response regulator
VQSESTEAKLKLSPALIVEDDPRTAQRLAHILSTLGIAESEMQFAPSVADAQRISSLQQFNLALVDVGLPDGSGVDLIALLRASQPQLIAVVVSAWGTEALIVAALRAGAVGYVLKERDDAEVSAALQSIEHGGAPIDPFVAKHILRLLVPPSAGATEFAALAEPLTAREHEILGLVAQGFISREIAEKLTRSKLTVECHIKNIYRKMQVTSRTEAVFRARSLGLLR